MLETILEDGMLFYDEDTSKGDGMDEGDMMDIRGDHKPIREV